MFFHDLDVVHAFGAGLAAADVFEVAALVALAVKVIGPHAFLFDRRERDLRHLARLFVARQLDVLFLHHLLEARAALDGEGVERDVVGAERRDLFHRVAHIVGRLAWQAEDDIHVDVRNARYLQGVEHLFDLLRRMAAADAVERFLLHGLRVDADARDMEAFHRLDFRRRHAVGTSGLDGKFCDVLVPERIADALEHFVKIRIGQARRRAAADVDVLDAEAVFCNRLLDGREVFGKNLHEFPQRLFARQDVRWERTVEATRQAERDADIDADGLFIRRLKKRHLAERHRGDEFCLFATTVVVVHETLDDARLVHAALPPAMHDLCRPHAVEDAPWRGQHREMLEKDTVEIALEQPVIGRAFAFIRGSLPRLAIAAFRAIGVVCIKQRFSAHAAIAALRFRKWWQLSMHDGELCKVRVKAWARNLDFEEVQHLLRDFDDNFLMVIDRQRLNLHRVPDTPCRLRRISPDGRAS